MSVTSWRWTLRRHSRSRVSRPGWQEPDLLHHSEVVEVLPPFRDHSVLEAHERRTEHLDFAIGRKSTEQVAGVPTAQDELRGEDVTVLHGAEDLHAQTVQGVEHLTVEGAQTIEVRHALRVAVRDDGRRVGRLPSGDSCRRQGRDRRVAITTTEDAAGLACVAASRPRPGARTGQRCPRLRRPRLLSRACCASRPVCSHSRGEECKCPHMPS